MLPFINFLALGYEIDPGSRLNPRRGAVSESRATRQSASPPVCAHPRAVSFDRTVFRFLFATFRRQPHQIFGHPAIVAWTLCCRKLGEASNISTNVGENFGSMPSCGRCIRVCTPPSLSASICGSSSRRWPTFAAGASYLISTRCVSPEDCDLSATTGSVDAYTTAVTICPGQSGVGVARIRCAV